MRIPDDAAIAKEKLFEYLLVRREHDDKSNFLGQAGFDLSRQDELLEALRNLASTAEAVEDGNNEYGDFYRAEGNLLGPNGSQLRVATIWLRWKIDGSFHFVTLKPQREKKSR